MPQFGPPNPDQPSDPDKDKSDFSEDQSGSSVAGTIQHFEIGSRWLTVEALLSAGRYFEWMHVRPRLLEYREFTLPPVAWDSSRKKEVPIPALKGLISLYSDHSTVIFVDLPEKLQNNSEKAMHAKLHLADGTILAQGSSENKEKAIIASMAMPGDLLTIEVHLKTLNLVVRATFELPEDTE